MRIEIISASAGSGKTFALSSRLEEEIREGRARPEAILATTFTNKAAAELQQRVRGRLLANGRAEDAQRLGGARIGTVNAVCGRLVTEFAFELGLSPELVVFDEVRAEQELRRSLAMVTSPAEAEELDALRERMPELDWRQVVRQLVDLARANGLGPEALRASAARSQEGFSALLGTPGDETSEALDAALEKALTDFEERVDTEADGTKKTAEALGKVRDALRLLRANRRLPWKDWVNLANLSPAVKSRALAAPVHEAAAAHDRHPRLRADGMRVIALCFDLAARALAAYAEHKRQWGALDFVDQEVKAIELLGRADVQARLRESLDLVLVDEFQDTSPLQLAIFLALARLAKRSIWVGDQKQSIFAFRGTDPALMDAALRKVLGSAEPTTLDKSWRSRPELVDITSDVFAQAFAAQGLPEARVRLTAARDEPKGLGAVVEHWSLQARNKRDTAWALAAGVSQLLAEGTKVRDRDTLDVRDATPGDIAVLCSTNEECTLAAEALQAVGIRADVPRLGLLETPEARLVLAGLRLYVDERDALAAAELARLIHYPRDPDGMMAALLKNPGIGAFTGLGFHERIAQAREHSPHAGALTGFDEVLEAVEARELCLAWGDSERRLANLDALRAHAVRYVNGALDDGGACTVAGLVAWFDELGRSHADSQAVGGGRDAVVVSTWHRAKGLEWPITVLFGSPKEGTALGVHAVSDQPEFDADAPLAGRWIRYWPNPYHAQQNSAPFHQRLDESPEMAEARARGRAQNLRLLYVGWTRARDRLVLAGRGQKLNSGFLPLLDAGSGPLLGEPENGVATWAGRKVQLESRLLEPAVPTATRPEPGADVVPAGPRVHPPAFVSPSSMKAEGALGGSERIGPRIALSGRPGMAHLGDAIHGFFAADRFEIPRAEREAIARGLLERWGVSGALQPAELVAASDAFRRWAEAKWPGAIWRREWPMQYRRPDGTVVRGTADLVLETGRGFVVVDHKSFPGSLEETAKRADAYLGQVGAYVGGLSVRRGDRVETWVHLPIQGAVVEVKEAAQAVG